MNVLIYCRIFLKRVVKSITIALIQIVKSILISI
ncbi:Uncharacterised protein [Legionella quateirensis]|uniref:Uncharacterized protein n=1 Tax=Legionella quateirensis TaxID=45072 RepID=A0A378KWA2_9GAMM|nr:Uncharacterised protein [Legionella quateirensis]